MTQYAPKMLQLGSILVPSWVQVGPKMPPRHAKLRLQLQHNPAQPPQDPPKTPPRPPQTTQDHHQI
eukprot:614925-Karenia_brevis.AAC.1